MFVIRSSEEEITIDWPVVVELPISGGSVKKFEFTGVFARLSEVELERLTGAANAAEEGFGKSRANSDAIAFFSKVLKGWSGVQDTAGKPVKYSADALETVLTGLDGMAVAIALWRAHNQMRAGAKAKN